PFGAELRDVDQALDSFLEFDEHPEIGNRTDLALDARVERVAFGDALPRIARRLFHPEAHALVLDLDAEHHRVDLVALLDQLRRMPHLARPREIRDMYEPVDARLDLNEHAEVCDRLDLAVHLATHGMPLRELLPGVRLGLLEAERNPAVHLVD